MIALPNWENIKTLLINFSFVPLYSHAFPLSPIVLLFNILMLQILTKKKEMSELQRVYKDERKHNKRKDMARYFFLYCVFSFINKGVTRFFFSF